MLYKIKRCNYNSLCCFFTNFFMLGGGFSIAPLSYVLTFMTLTTLINDHHV